MTELFTYGSALLPKNKIEVIYWTFWYLWIYVTAIKPNFQERFRAYNGKNRNMPTKHLASQI